MQIIDTVSALRLLISAYKQQGKFISLVPTMGNLHEGHLQLVDKARAENAIVVASVFVNPLQFDENKDLEKYPRTLQQDAEQLLQRGCDILFAPAVKDIYPASKKHGRDQTQVVVPGISEILEGASRPGHFLGVTTIVSKLFNLVQPDQAIFGEKDYQQLQIIRQMVKELNFPVEILSLATVREVDGLAMSSRNVFLSEIQRRQACKLYQTLQQVAEQLLAGNKDFAALEEAGLMELNQQGFNADYVAIRAKNLQTPDPETKHLVILAAARLGNTRLIDNVQLQCS